MAGSPLDDYLYRLVPYLKAFVQADETPRTLCLDLAEDDGEGKDAEGNECRRFFADGSEDPHVVSNPLEADFDLILRENVDRKQGNAQGKRNKATTHGVSS